MRDLFCAIKFFNVFTKINERSHDSYICLADFFFHEKVLKCSNIYRFSIIIHFLNSLEIHSLKMM